MIKIKLSLNCWLLLIFDNIRKGKIRHSLCNEFTSHWQNVRKFWTYFRTKIIFVPIFEKSVNFVHFANGRWTHYYKNHCKTHRIFRKYPFKRDFFDIRPVSRIIMKGKGINQRKFDLLLLQICNNVTTLSIEIQWKSPRNFLVYSSILG